MTWLIAFLLSLAGFGPPPSGAPTPGGAVTIPVEDASAGGPLPRLTPARGSDPPIVVIDPGHGGRDPGARAAVAGTVEKDVTLALARAVRDELAATGRVRVALTRDDDIFIPLE